MNLHPTLTTWNRDEEEGGYAAEVEGARLHVTWRDGDGATPARRPGFSWTVTGPGERKLASTEVVEEIEDAMALAERAAAASRGDAASGEAAAADEGSP